MKTFPNRSSWSLAVRSGWRTLVTQVLPLGELAHALELLKTDVDGRMKIILEH